ncbi:MAG: thiopurine S-methyltransferase [Chromatiales bacterium]|jgi:thiopurine S-methyltransferase|nr:thiopurine S-methyltransferase [Chromatiales bacterium]
MDAGFWLRKWENNEIGFHEGVPNALLVKYFSELGLAPGSRVFLPLCGKTRDLNWLLSEGYRVTGAELSEMAVQQWFASSGIEPVVAELAALKVYSAPQIDIFVGDIFSLSPALLGVVDAIYDRAALVALPADMRSRYTALLRALTDNAPQLLVCFEYDQSAMDGPPFSIDDEEVCRHYGDFYQLALRERHEMVGGLRGKCAARENIWLLKKKY